MSRKSPFISDWLLFTAFIISVGGISFIGGVAALHYKTVLGEGLRQSLEGGEAWVTNLTKAKGDIKVDIDSAVKTSNVTWDKQRAGSGFTLITMWDSTTAYLIGMDGKIAHSWSMPFSKVWPHPVHIRSPLPDSRISWETAYAMPNGDLIADYIAVDETPYAYGMVRLDKDSHVLWAYPGHTHHDLYVDKHDGSIYALSEELVTKPIAGAEFMPYPMYPDSILILSPEGKELKKIPVIQAFLGTPYELMLRRNNNWDFLHTNSIMKLEPEMAAAFPMFKAGQILLSVRGLGALVVIDPDTQKVVWAIQGMWRGQHAAHFVNNGHIILLDNNGDSAGNIIKSRILEIDPATQAVTWSYTGTPVQPFYTRILGRTQRLANGNTFVGESMSARLFEVTPDGSVVWDYRLPQINKQWETADGKKYTGNASVVIAGATRYSAEELQFLNTP